MYERFRSEEARVAVLARGETGGGHCWAGDTGREEGEKSGGWVRKRGRVGNCRRIFEDVAKRFFFFFFLFAVDKLHEYEGIEN